MFHISSKTPLMREYDLFICETWLIGSCHTYKPHMQDLEMTQCSIRMIHTWDMAHSYVGDMTHPCMHVWQAAQGGGLRSRPLPWRNGARGRPVPGHAHTFSVCLCVSLCVSLPLSPYLSLSLSLSVSLFLSLYLSPSLSLSLSLSALLSLSSLVKAKRVSEWET